MTESKQTMLFFVDGWILENPVVLICIRGTQFSEELEGV
jgi:hypothetical protein